MVRSLPVARVARKLLLVPVLVFALLVVLVEATASPPADRGQQSTYVAPPGNAFGHAKFGGDGRRMR